MRRSRSVWVLWAVLAIGASPPAALGAVGWTKISTDDKSSIDSPSLAFAGSSVVAAFPRANNGVSDAETDTFTPSADAGTLQSSIKRTDAATGLSSVSTWVIPSAGAPGGLQIMLSGSNGTSFAQRNADGTWAAPVSTGLVNGATSGSAVTAIAGADNQTPAYVFVYGGDLWFQVGATGRTSATEVHIGASQLGGHVQANGPRLGRDAAGRYWLTWYNSVNPSGVYLLQFDPATGQPIGSAALAPSSDSPANGEGRIALACAAQCRVVFHESDAQGNNTSKLGVWGVGDSATTTVAGPVQPNALITATGVPGGGMWVVWHEESGTAAYHAVLADDHGAGGSNRNLGQPTKDGLPVQSAALAAQDGGLIFVTNWLDTGPATDAMWARVIPGTPPLYSGPTKQTSTTVGNTVLTLVSPKNCVAPNSRIIAKLAVKAVKKRHRKVGKGIVFIKVKSVDFGVDGKRRSHDAKQPFKATLVLTGLTPGSKHTLYARALLKTHPGQPAIHRTVRSTFKICG